MSDEENSFDKMEEALARHMAQVAKAEQCKQIINDRLDKTNESAESEILLKLWTTLGDSPHPYYVAMVGVHEFIKALRRMRKIGHVPIDVHIIVLEAIRQVAELDIESLRIIKEERDKHNI